jgi:hypothetical protein
VEITAGFISIGVLMIVQLVAFAYGYGKLNQKLTDNCEKTNKIWNKVFNGGGRT